MNEYQLRERINKRFSYDLKPNEVMRWYVRPLIKRNWLAEVKDRSNNIWYVRIGGFGHVRSEQTLFDQFKDLSPDLRDSFIDYVDREAWDDIDFFDSLTETEYNDYWQKEYEKYMERERKLTQQEIEGLYKALGID